MESVKINPENGTNHLSAEEREAPVSVILDLFSCSSLYHLRVYLWQYLKAATSEKGWHQLRQPLDAVVLQRRLERLMEACWLLLLEKEKRDGEVALPCFVPGTAEWLEDNRQMHLEHSSIEAAYGGSILCLRQRELDYPMLVLKEFFSTLPLGGWKSLLEEWTEYALCATSLLQDTENYNLLLHYEQLERLLEVVYYFTLLLDTEEDILGRVPEQKKDGEDMETAAT